MSLYWKECSYKYMERKRGAKISTLMDHMTEQGIRFKDRKRDKYDLMLMGYFHGYQNSRFIIGKDKNGLNFSKRHLIRFKSFTQVQQIYRINNDLNVFFYPILIQVITGLKSYITYFLVNHGCWYLSDIYENCMNNRINLSVPHVKKMSNNKARKIEHSNYIMKSFRKLEKSNQTYNQLSKLDNKSKYHAQTPIWALFDLVTLHQLAYFCGCLYHDVDMKLEKFLGLLDPRFNRNGGLLSKHLNIILYLRNAVAHNKIIFDCRFQGNNNIKSSVMKKLQQDSHVKPIRFNSIVDYFLLLADYQHLLHVKQSVIRNEAKHLSEILSTFKDDFHYSRFHESFGNRPLSKLKEFYFKSSNSYV